MLSIQCDKEIHAGCQGFSENVSIWDIGHVAANLLHMLLICWETNLNVGSIEQQSQLRACVGMFFCDHFLNLFQHL